MDAQTAARIVSLENRVKELQRRTRPLFHRGWFDDFMGRVLSGYYQGIFLGGSIALMDSAHGGWVRYTANAGAGNYAYLMLGDGAGTYDTLSAGEGFTMICRYRSLSTTDVYTGFGIVDPFIWNDFIFADHDTWAAQPTRWRLIQRTGGGGITEAYGPVVDTDWHVHRLDAAPIGGGVLEATYTLDGEIIATLSPVTSAILTPICRLFNRGAAIRYMYLDYWLTRPWLTP